MRLVFFFYSVVILKKYVLVLPAENVKYNIVDVIVLKKQDLTYSNYCFEKNKLRFDIEVCKSRNEYDKNKYIVLNLLENYDVFINVYVLIYLSNKKICLISNTSLDSKMWIHRLKTTYLFKTKEELNNFIINNGLQKNSQSCDNIFTSSFQDITYNNLYRRSLDSLPDSKSNLITSSLQVNGGEQWRRYYAANYIENKKVMQDVNIFLDENAKAITEESLRIVPSTASENINGDIKEEDSYEETDDMNKINLEDFENSRLQKDDNLHNKSVPNLETCVSRSMSSIINYDAAKLVASDLKNSLSNGSALSNSENSLHSIGIICEETTPGVEDEMIHDDDNKELSDNTGLSEEVVKSLDDSVQMSTAPADKELDLLEKDSAIEGIDFVVQSNDDTVKNKDNTVEVEGSAVESNENAIESNDSAVEHNDDTVENKDITIEGSGNVLESNDSAVEHNDSLIELNDSILEGNDIIVENSDSILEGNDSDHTTVNTGQQEDEYNADIEDGKKVLCAVEEQNASEDDNVSCDSDKQSVQETKLPEIEIEDNTNKLESFLVLKENDPETEKLENIKAGNRNINILIISIIFVGVLGYVFVKKNLNNTKLYF